MEIITMDNSKTYRKTIKMMVDNVGAEIERIENVEIPSIDKIVDGGRKHNDKQCEEHFYQMGLEEISVRDRLISILHDFIRDSKCDKISAYIKKSLDKMDCYDPETYKEKYSYKNHNDLKTINK